MTPTLRSLAPLGLLALALAAGCDSAAPTPPPGPPPFEPPPPEALTAELIDPAMVKEVVDAECRSFLDVDAGAALFHVVMSAARQGGCAPAHALTDPAGRQLTAGEWAGASGEVAVACLSGGTQYRFTFEGLVPGGVYTIWHFPPGGGGALASHPGDIRNVFTASAGTTTFTVVGTAGPMTMGGTVPACTLPVPPRAEVGDIGGELFVVLYHKDGRSWGGVPGPEETIAGHLVFLGR